MLLHAYNMMKYPRENESELEEFNKNKNDNFSSNKSTKKRSQKGFFVQNDLFVDN